MPVVHVGIVAEAIFEYTVAPPAVPMVIVANVLVVVVQAPLTKRFVPINEKHGQSKVTYNTNIPHLDKRVD